jgi:antitoxin YefM
VLLQKTGGAVKTLDYAEALARFDEVLDSVVDDREEVVITRAGHTPVVMVALDDYEALQETVHLLRSPANARRLLYATERLESDRGDHHELVDAD